MEFQKLDELIMCEKKSTASQAKKEEYLSEMIALLKEEGFSDKAEIYLAKGFSFAGALPIGEFIKSYNMKEQTDFISQILRCSTYRDNKHSLGLKIGFSLLAQNVNLFPENTTTLKQIIRDLPLKACDTPDHQFSKDLPLTIKTYFCDALYPDTQLPSLEKLELKKLVIDDFKKIFSVFLENSKYTEKCSVPILDKINAWILQPSTSIEQRKEDAVKKPNNNINSNAKKDSETSIKPKKKENLKTALTGKELNQLSLLLLDQADSLSATADKLSSLEISKTSLNKKINTLEKNIETISIQKEKCESKIVELKNSIEISDINCKHMESEIYALKRQINERDNSISGLTAEINKLKSVLSVYSADKANSQNEQLNQIASKLKSEWIDFMDVESAEMTLDLGENFRYQIKSIFKTLKKAGIDVGGR